VQWKSAKTSEKHIASILKVEEKSKQEASMEQAAVRASRFRKKTTGLYRNRRELSLQANLSVRISSE
jgi:hypothetical protein